jgi:hypothetical protein
MKGSAHGHLSAAPSMLAAACATSGATRRLAAKTPPQRLCDLMLRSIAARTERIFFHGLGCAAMRLEA